MQNSQLISVWTATLSCGAQTDKGGINLFIELEKLKPNQIDWRNIRMSVQEHVAFSK